MPDILDVLDKVGGVIGQFRGSMATALKWLDNQKEQLAINKTRQDEREKSLEARETAVKKIEDIIALSAFNDNMLREINKKNTELLHNKQDFDNFYAEKVRYLTEWEQKVKSEDENTKARNEKESNSLAKLRQELEQAMATYKIVLAQGLVETANNLNKKR